jgi:NAD(P)-dependent dehydrogenase (short-subunit alcohol dehydrogenase family)
MNRLRGKSALIIGADAITQGIAKRFVMEGASVTIAADRAALKDSKFDNVAILELSGENNDADRAAIKLAVGAALDILLLGGDDIPGEELWTPVSALSLDQFRNTQDRMVARPLIVLQACETALKESGRSSVIFLFSSAGFYSEGGWSDYTIAYHARSGLMRAVAAEWGPVRSNMLVPFANSPGFQAARARNPKEVDFRVSVTPMRRVGDLVEDIGGAAVFLGSDDTQYVTGMMIHADGGAFLTIPTIETSMEHA